MRGATRWALPALALAACTAPAGPPIRGRLAPAPDGAGAYELRLATAAGAPVAGARIRALRIGAPFAPHKAAPGIGAWQVLADPAATEVAPGTYRLRLAVAPHGAILADVEARRPGGAAAVVEVPVDPRP